MQRERERERERGPGVKENSVTGGSWNHREHECTSAHYGNRVGAD